METIKKHNDKELAISTPDTIISVEQLLRDKEMAIKIIEDHQKIIDRVDFLLNEAKKLDIKIKEEISEILSDKDPII